MSISKDYRKAKPNTKTLCLKEFTDSALFTKLFTEGMALVDEITNWLEGPGHGMAQSLSRDQALSYAVQSLDMTTRLIQIANWLMIHRAVRDGEASANDLQNPKFRLPSADPSNKAQDSGISPKFAKLNAKTNQFYERLYRLDLSMHESTQLECSSEPHPLDRLKMAQRDGNLT